MMHDVPPLQVKRMFLKLSDLIFLTMPLKATMPVSLPMDKLVSAHISWIRSMCVCVWYVSMCVHACMCAFVYVCHS